MSNLSTLKPFQSGPDPRRNTRGRPKGSKNMKNLLMKELQKEFNIGENKKIKLDELIVRRLVDIALNDPKTDRRFAATKFIWEKIDGKEKPHLSLPRYHDHHIDPVRKKELMQLIGLEVDERTEKLAAEELSKRGPQITQDERPPIQLDI